MLHSVCSEPSLCCNLGPKLNNPAVWFGAVNKAVSLFRVVGTWLHLGDFFYVCKEKKIKVFPQIIHFTQMLCSDCCCFLFFFYFSICFTSSVVCLLKISGNILGNLVLTIKVVSCVVRSNSTCPVAKELPFRTEACSSSSCPNSARLSFSLDQLQELTSTTWGLECSVQVCYSEVGDETEWNTPVSNAIFVCTEHFTRAWWFFSTSPQPPAYWWFYRYFSSCWEIVF